MPPAEIPGYYFDQQKKKYFKIEKSHANPSGHSSSADAVRKRKLEDQARHEVQKRANLVRNHIKRHPLARDVVTGALLARETELGRVAEVGRGRLEIEDVAAAAWARGVVPKGRVAGEVYQGGSEGMLRKMVCFYVAGEDAGVQIGSVYASANVDYLMGAYLPTNENDQIRESRDNPVPPLTTTLIPETNIEDLGTTDIKYHRHSKLIIAAGRVVYNEFGVKLFSPVMSEPGDGGFGPHWRLGEVSDHVSYRLRVKPGGTGYCYRSVPAPPSSNLLCILGGDDGLMQLDPADGLSMIGYRGTPPKGIQQPREVFAQDFQTGNHNVVFAGCRKPRLWTADLRAPVAEWSFVKTRSSIDHVRSVNPNHVLVSGLQNSMALYDIRLAKDRVNGPKPLLLFPEHRNESRFNLGFDVSTRLGVVAAAQEDGRVRLFSLRSGRRLRSAGVDGWYTQDPPIRSLMFQQMPGERLPSLWVGRRMGLCKYAFGSENIEDEA